jgi:hypothetical protein
MLKPFALPPPTPPHDTSKTLKNRFEIARSMPEVRLAGLWMPCKCSLCYSPTVQEPRELTVTLMSINV